MQGYFWLHAADWVGREDFIKRAPALLLGAKPPLLKALQEMAKRGSNGVNFYQQNSESRGRALWAQLWMQLASGLAQTFRRPYSVKTEDWRWPDIEPATLRNLMADLSAPGKKQGHHPLLPLIQGADALESLRASRSAPAKIVAAPPPETVAPSAHKYDEIGRGETFNLFRNGMSQGVSMTEAREKFDAFEGQTLKVNDEIKIAILVAPTTHLENARRALPRLLFWKVWARELGDGGAARLKAELWERTEPQLWARMEEILEAHRKVATEPLEPKIERKLSEREANAWRAQVRGQRRGELARDIIDIADVLVAVAGLEAHLKAIERTNRPDCRDICSQLQLKLFSQLDSLPIGTNAASAAAAPREVWEAWLLDESWDAILERAETCLAGAKDEWTRNVLECELATGAYRRGDFAKFESHVKGQQNFPNSVAAATVAFDDFAAWRVLLEHLDAWNAMLLLPFWQSQQRDGTRRARVIGAAAKIVASASSEDVAKELLKWLLPLEATAFEAHLASVEDALESPIIPVKKWAMKVLGALNNADFDCERAIQTASEMLWHENASLAKDAANFLAMLSAQDVETMAIAWDALNDATSLDNVGLCEAIYRALVKMRSKHKSLELSDAARGKLKDLSAAQADRFGKFVAKLN